MNVLLQLFLKSRYKARICRLSVLLVIFAVLCTLSSCQKIIGNDDSSSSETLVTLYTYNLNYNSTYARVNKFNCVDNGDSTYKVRSAEVHLFSKATYGSRTRNELCDMVSLAAVSASGNGSGTLSSDKTYTVTGTLTGTAKTFYLYSGMQYPVYYYY